MTKEITILLKKLLKNKEANSWYCFYHPDTIEERITFFQKGYSTPLNTALLFSRMKISQHKIITNNLTYKISPEVFFKISPSNFTFSSLTGYPIQTHFIYHLNKDGILEARKIVDFNESFGYKYKVFFNDLYVNFIDKFR